VDDHFEPDLIPELIPITRCRELLGDEARELSDEDVERKFLEPVARYLAILQEWSLERPSEGTGTVPPSEQP
jgi:hypothetical protein